MICNTIPRVSNTSFQRKFTAQEIAEIRDLNANTHNRSLVYIRTKQIRAKDGAIGQLKNQILKDNPTHDFAKKLIKELRLFINKPSIIGSATRKR